VNMVDVSPAKAFGVLFEAPWVRASGFTGSSLDGFLEAVSGLCNALSDCVYGSNVGDVLLARSNRWQNGECVISGAETKQAIIFTSPMYSKGTNCVIPKPSLI
jgi:hypothetical protein